MHGEPQHSTGDFLGGKVRNLWTHEGPRHRKPVDLTVDELPYTYRPRAAIDHVSQDQQPTIPGLLPNG